MHYVTVAGRRIPAGGRRAVRVIRQVLYLLRTGSILSRHRLCWQDVARRATKRSQDRLQSFIERGAHVIRLQFASSQVKFNVGCKITAAENNGGTAISCRGSGDMVQNLGTPLGHPLPFAPSHLCYFQRCQTNSMQASIYHWAPW
jgi:hypothetical protein